MVSTQTLRARLKTKVERLLWESAIPGRDTFVERFLEPAVSCSTVGLIGGAVRDLAFQSIREFNSDVDFVLCVDDRHAFDRMISKLNLKRNAFGGYRTEVGGLRVDFWEASGSWAHLNGHYKVSSLEDIRHTTFFNLDALIFDVGGRKLIADEKVLQGLLDKFLDINLRPNPNEDGAAVRALRRLWKHQLNASQTLIEFLSDRIESSGWEALIDRDRKAFPQAPVLSDLFCSYRPSGAKFKQDMMANRGRLLPSKQYEFDFLQEA